MQQALIKAIGYCNKMKKTIYFLSQLSLFDNLYILLPLEIFLYQNLESNAIVF